MSPLTPLGDPLDRSPDKPTHQLVRERLEDLVRQGVYEPGSQLPGEPEIAAALGVSRMTANRAILALVADGVLERAKGKGTFVSQSPRAPLGLRRVVGVANEDPSYAWEDFYFGVLLSSLSRACQSEGLEFSVLDRLHPSLDQIDDSTGVVLIAFPHHQQTVARELADRAGRVVALGCSWDDFPWPTVDSDNILGAGLAIEHLAGLGHRDIAYVGAFPEDSNTQDRWRGYEVQMQLRGLTPYRPLFFTRMGGSDEGTDGQVMDLLTGPRPPTAIFAAGAEVALRITSLARRLDIRLPLDLSIVAYDEPSYFSLIEPAMTTIRQPLREMAENALQILLRDRTAPPGMVVRHAPTLVVQASTAPVHP